MYERSRLIRNNDDMSSYDTQHNLNSLRSEVSSINARAFLTFLIFAALFAVLYVKFFGSNFTGSTGATGPQGLPGTNGNGTSFQASNNTTLGIMGDSSTTFNLNGGLISFPSNQLGFPDVTVQGNVLSGTGGDLVLTENPTLINATLESTVTVNGDMTVTGLVTLENGINVTGEALFQDAAFNGSIRVASIDSGNPGEPLLIGTQSNGVQILQGSTFLQMADSGASLTGGLVTVSGSSQLFLTSQTVVRIETTIANIILDILGSGSITISAADYSISMYSTSQIRMTSVHETTLSAKTFIVSSNQISTILTQKVLLQTTFNLGITAGTLGMFLPFSATYDTQGSWIPGPFYFFRNQNLETDVVDISVTALIHATGGTGRAQISVFDQTNSVVVAFAQETVLSGAYATLTIRTLLNMSWFDEFQFQTSSPDTLAFQVLTGSQAVVVNAH